VTRGNVRQVFVCINLDGAVPAEAVMTSSAAIIVLKYAKDLHAEWACEVECTPELEDVKRRFFMMCLSHLQPQRSAHNRSIRERAGAEPKAKAA